MVRLRRLRICLAHLNTVKRLMAMQLTDNERLDFLKRLDAALLEVTDWEATFIESCLKRSSFSPKQQDAIDKMIKNYQAKIKWLPPS